MSALFYILTCSINKLNMSSIIYQIFAFILFMIFAQHLQGRYLYFYLYLKVLYMLNIVILYHRYHRHFFKVYNPPQFCDAL